MKPLAKSRAGCSHPEAPLGVAHQELLPNFGAPTPPMPAPPRCFLHWRHQNLPHAPSKLRQGEKKKIKKKNQNFCGVCFAVAQSVPCFPSQGIQREKDGEETQMSIRGADTAWSSAHPWNSHPFMPGFPQITDFPSSLSITNQREGLESRLVPTVQTPGNNCVYLFPSCSAGQQAVFVEPSCSPADEEFDIPCVHMQKERDLCFLHFFPCS